MRPHLISALLLIVTSPISAISSAYAQNPGTDIELTQALAEVTKQLQTTPDAPDLLFRKGVILTKLNQTDAAIAQFKALIEHSPMLPEAHNNLAVLYAQQKQYQAAQDALQQAIATHTSYATAQENLKAIYRQLASIAYNRALNSSTASTPRMESPLLLIEELPQAHEKHLIAAAAEPVEADNQPIIQAPQETPKLAPAADLSLVDDAIEAWAQAWSAQDVTLYLSKYSADFMVPDRLSLNEWQNIRRARLTKPRFIEVTTSQLKKLQLDDYLVSVSFKQHYASNTFKDNTNKQLLLKWEQDRWLIIQENEIK